MNAESPWEWDLFKMFTTDILVSWWNPWFKRVSHPKSSSFSWSSAILWKVRILLIVLGFQYSTLAKFNERNSAWLIFEHFCIRQEVFKRSHADLRENSDGKNHHTWGECKVLTHVCVWLLCEHKGKTGLVIYFSSKQFLCNFPAGQGQLTFVCCIFVHQCMMCQSKFTSL